ncbi:MAG: cardiolipin synthase [Clostridiales bacterium]|nr:cardiolipin synthase [Clostridiales bacterium]
MDSKDFSKNLEELKGTAQIRFSGFIRILVVGLLVLLQLLIVFFFTYWLRGNYVYVYLFLQLTGTLAGIVLVNSYKNASYKIAWLCTFMIFPLTGHIMFLLWGNRLSKIRMEKRITKFLNAKSFTYLIQEEGLRERFAKQYPHLNNISIYLENHQFPLYKNNKLKYYSFGEEVFRDILKDIKNAKKFVFINFYIVAQGVLLDELFMILRQKVKEGVEVKFMYDDFGASLRTPKNFKKKLEEAGIEVAVFNPIHKYTDRLYLNYRSHQKIIVIDGNIAYTGGMNLADEYANLVDRFGVWKDSAIRVLGDAAWGFTVIFLQMWEICGKLPKCDYNDYRPTMDFEENDVFCHVVADGPANNPENPIESLYRQIIYNAREYLYIATPYLVIEDDLKEALITSAKSGVDVRIVTPYIPDKKNVKLLTEYNYGPLLEGGVKILEYKPGFIHSKVIISDSCGVVGTINMDYRSFYLHYEDGLFFCDQETIKVIHDYAIKTMEDCIIVDFEEWKRRPMYLKAYQYVLNLFQTLI